MSTETEDGVDPGVLKEARTMGWVPQEQFKGDPDQWVSAEDFVDRGKHVMPILLENNKRLQRELSTRDEKIGTLQSQLTSATVAIGKLEKHYTEANKRAVETARTQLKNELKQAREDDDIDKELDIQDKMKDLDKSLENAEKENAKVPVEPEPASGLSPDFLKWNKDNPWYGEDKKRTKAINRIAEDLRDEGNTTLGVDFMDECLRILEDQEGGQKETPRQSSKVEGSSSRGSRASGDKSYADLPKDAKDACMSDAEDLVGEGKRYKDIKAWQSAYAKIYYSE